MTTWRKIKENPDLIPKYLIREKVIDTIRDFFKSRGFHEVQTPILIPVPSAESNLEVFETRLETSSGKKRRAFLILSPEYSLKKLIAAGLGNIFEITRSFRNREEVSPTHNPEFTMLEWYRVGADYRNIMEDFENLFFKIIGKNKMMYQNEEYDLSLPWPRISFAQAFKKYAGRNLEEVKDEDFYQIFFNEVEPQLRASHKPAFVYDYPVSQASLARKKASDPRFAERWEVFLAGVELGNCFSELTDWKEQSKRLEEDLLERKRLGKNDFPMDADFISALKAGMPETAGIAVGVDRLVMLAADTADVSETLFFPGKELFDL
jgi:lysyl-tRNA synthetase class 2